MKLHSCTKFRIRWCSSQSDFNCAPVHEKMNRKVAYTYVHVSSIRIQVVICSKVKNVGYDAELPIIAILNAAKSFSGVVTSGRLSICIGIVP